MNVHFSKSAGSCGLPEMTLSRYRTLPLCFVLVALGFVLVALAGWAQVQAEQLDAKRTDGPQQTSLHISGTEEEAGFREQARYVSGFTPGLNPPISERAQAAKQQSIREKLRDIATRLARIEGRREEINAEFSDVWRVRQKKYQTYKGPIWGHIGKGFFTLPPEYTLLHAKAEVESYEHQWQDNLAALIALNEFLELNGVQFIAVMYPHARALSARVFLPEFAQYPDEKELRIAQKLLEHDIEVIAFTDRAVAQATEYPFMYFYPIDFHPGEGTQEVAAEVIAEHLQRFAPEFTPQLDAADFAPETENNVYTEKFTYPAGVDIGSHKAGEIVRIPKTYYRGKPIEFDKASKLLVCGHSFIQTPAYSAFLSSALAGRIRYVPHNWQISSVGPYTSIPRRLLLDRQKLLHGKRVCVMIFDSYFAISSTIEPVNVRTIDRRLLMLHDKQQRHEFDLGKLAALRPEPCEQVQRFVQATHADEKGYPLLQISQPGESISLGKLTLPEDLRAGQDVWLLIEFCLSNKQMVEVAVGEDTVAAEFHQIPTWQEIFLKLPAQAHDIEVQFKALKSEALFTIRKIALYQ
jgi:hypothetical protein